ncbi:plasmid partitioning protein RepB [Pseudooceanicola onchidii]|uniref:plasmid partitioning protein RepB n=1 Tax=Pseudooceanicola onchidii TaxID=2562279 RepID=UPI0010A9B0B4|nr:plasmid partitioning protein RepB [Pseudooceanicola onchidii]
MARKGILTPNITPRTDTPAPRRQGPAAAVGALQSSLSKLQENAVQDIDPSLIDMAGMEDRLGFYNEEQKRLKESLKAYGQQVPVLLRPHPTARGRYEIVYGRRRLAALRDLGMPVRAMVRQLDDHALVMAQGQENTERTDLSFIEKASFAAQLDAAGYDRQTIAAALAMDMPMVSRMLKVGTAFDLAFLRQIGRAPSVGRDRWMTLVEKFKNEGARNRATAFMNRPEFAVLGTDDRFDAVLRIAEKQPDAKAPAPKVPARKASITTPDGTPLATLSASDKGVNLAVRTEGFDRWIEENADDLLNEWFARWQSAQATDQD